MLRLMLSEPGNGNRRCLECAVCTTGVLLSLLQFDRHSAIVQAWSLAERHRHGDDRPAEQILLELLPADWHQQIQEYALEVAKQALLRAAGKLATTGDVGDVT